MLTEKPATVHDHYNTQLYRRNNLYYTRQSQRQTSACRDGTLKNQLCLVFLSCVHRKVVERSGVGSAGCVVHVGVHGDIVGGC